MSWYESNFMSYDYESANLVPIIHKIQKQKFQYFDDFLWVIHLPKGKQPNSPNRVWLLFLWYKIDR